MTITASNIVQLTPSSVTLDSVDMGALAKDSVSLEIKYTLRQVQAAQTKATIKQVIDAISASLKFTSSEFNRARMALLLGLTDASELKINANQNELTRVSAEIVVAYRGNTATITGTVEVDPSVTLNFDATKDGALPFVCAFVPDDAADLVSIVFAGSTV